MNQSPRQPSEPSLKDVVLGDLRKGDLHRGLRRDLQDLYRFYLTDERREQLDAMGMAHRILYFTGWLTKSLLMKLSPTRRIALLASLLCVLLGDLNLTGGRVAMSINFRPLGILILLIILMLELKDKLLARDEIEVARQVQLALLPSFHPQPRGWSVWCHTRPANDVGGDLVDYLERGDGKLGCALGDVSGKGLGAALLSARLQATLHALAPDAANLSDLGARLNASLLRDELKNRFATLFYLEIEPGTGRLRCLNAGHNPAYLRRAEGKLEEIGASGPPLGISGTARYADRALELHPGDLLIVYSDGLTEARDAADREFGEQRLKEIVARLKGESASRIGAILLAEADRFLGDARPADDLSIVVVARSVHTTG